MLLVQPLVIHFAVDVASNVTTGGTPPPNATLFVVLDRLGETGQVPVWQRWSPTICMVLPAWALVGVTERILGKTANEFALVEACLLSEARVKMILPVYVFVAIAGISRQTVVEVNPATVHGPPVELWSVARRPNIVDVPVVVPK